MRKILPLCLLLCSLAHAQAAFKQITLSWTNPNSAAADGWPPCNFASSPTDICVEGPLIQDITNASSPVTLAVACTATVTTSCLSATATSFVITPLPTAGSHTYAIMFDGLNSTGGADNSPAATVQVTVPSASPLAPAVSATLQ